MTLAAAKLAPPLAADAMQVGDLQSVLQRAQAMACTLPKNNAPSCEGAVHLGLFFDGTGNNRDADLPQHKHSNVVRLWMAHRDSAQEAGGAGSYYRPEYIPGVGTAFPEVGESASNTLDGLDKFFGKAVALGGQARIFWGLLQAINVMHRFVKNNTPLFDDPTAGNMARQWSHDPVSVSIGKAKLKDHVKTLEAALKGRKPKVSSLTLSVFGFSRGAAEARAFCNDFYAMCHANGGQEYTLAGVKVVVKFLGLFDTVASVGLVGADVLNIEGHQGWAGGGALKVHPAIKRCVHFVAAHEVRSCFSLDSVRQGDSYPPHVEEVIYPGSHANVGGGYRPGAQGRSPLPPKPDSYAFLAMVPGIHMYREALLAGVPLKLAKYMPPEELRNFTPNPELLAAYNAYVAADTQAGSTEEVLARRMDRYRFYRFRRLDRFVKDAKAQGSPTEDAKFLELINQHFAERCHDLQRRYANAKRMADRDHERVMAEGLSGKIRPTDIQPAKSLLAYLNQTIIKEDLDMWLGMHRSGDTPAALETLFDRYVHDSMAGFAQDGVDEYALNGRGILRNRDVYDKGGA